MAIRPGGSLGQTLVGVANGAVQATRYGTVQSVGKTTCDVLLDGGGGLLQKVTISGARPAVNARVAVQTDADGNTIAVTPAMDATSAQGAGLVILGGKGGVGDPNPRFPLPHAATHAAGGSDPLTPAQIGAATPGDITSAVAAHVAASNPHTMYLLKSGGTLTGDVQSYNYTAGLAGWIVKAMSGSAEFNNVKVRGEFSASVFTAQEVHATGGTFLVLTAGNTYDTLYIPPEDLVLDDGANIQLDDAAYITW